MYWLGPVTILPAQISPPTPIPPNTRNAPVVVDVDCVLELTTKLPKNVAVVPNTCW